MNNKALVVLSGGQDSTTCLFWALKHFDEVHALSFTYGQKHTHEVEIAKAICAEQQVPYEVMDKAQNILLLVLNVICNFVLNKICLLR